MRNARPRKACSSNKGGIRDNSSSSANVKGPLPETEQRPFFVSASRRVHGDCITENILQRHQAPGIPGDVPLFRKLIPNLEAIQLAIWQIPIFLQTTHYNSRGNSYLIGKRRNGTTCLASINELSICLWRNQGITRESIRRVLLLFGSPSGPSNMPINNMRQFMEETEPEFVSIGPRSVSASTIFDPS